jgi:hypothetical protein
MFKIDMKCIYRTRGKTYGRRNSNNHKVGWIEKVVFHEKDYRRKRMKKLASKI